MPIKERRVRKVCVQGGPESGCRSESPGPWHTLSRAAPVLWSGESWPSVCSVPGPASSPEPVAGGLMSTAFPVPWSRGRASHFGGVHSGKARSSACWGAPNQLPEIASSNASCRQCSWPPAGPHVARTFPRPTIYVITLSLGLGALIPTCHPVA